MAQYDLISFSIIWTAFSLFHRFLFVFPKAGWIFSKILPCLQNTIQKVHMKPMSNLAFRMPAAYAGVPKFNSWLWPPANADPGRQ